VGLDLTLSKKKVVAKGKMHYYIIIIFIFYFHTGAVASAGPLINLPLLPPSNDTWGMSYRPPAAPLY
jgi:hypothetical protein